MWQSDRAGLNISVSNAGLDSEQTFRELISQYFTRQMSGPFDYEARQKAGFTITELKALECMEITVGHSGKTSSNRS